MRFTISRSQQVWLLATLMLISSGCRSSSRWASLNPWSSSDQETSLAARSAPELPTAQAENPGGTAIAQASPAASGGEAPAYVAQAPSSPYPTAGTTPTAPPVTPPSLAVNTPPSQAYPNTAPSQSYPSTPSMPTAPPVAASGAGPYNPDGYQPAPSNQVAQTKPDSAYGGSRYESTGSLPLADIPPIDSAPPVPPVQGGDRYASSPAEALPSLPPAFPASAQQPIAQASNTRVAIPSQPGGYRPGGTSSYDPQVSVALRTAPDNPAPPVSSSPPATGYPSTQPAYPSYPTSGGNRY